MFYMLFQQHDVQQGLVRLQYYDHGQWKNFDPTAQDITNRMRRGLIGHWRMDEQTGNEIADDSGHEHHATASGPSPALAKFSRGRLFSFSSKVAPMINVPNTPLLNFGASFTVSGWIKILNVKYPRTTFAVRKGFGCYFGPLRSGWNPGWEIGHGYSNTGTDVCIRDHLNNLARGVIVHDDYDQPPFLVNKWAHYVFVFDRKVKKVFLYLNGRLQKNSLDISRVTGSITNSKNLEFGTLYGWKTDGYLDEYRLFNFPLNAVEVAKLYQDHLI